MVAKQDMVSVHSNSDEPCLAVVGCGHWGKNLVRNFAELGALAAVCDENPEVAGRLADQYRTNARDWSSILADPAVQAVAIATPAVLHFSLAQAALEAGKHVFVEKPLALTTADAERLCDLSEQRGRQLMVGHLMHYHPAFLRLQSLVREGALGRLQYIYSNRLNLGKIRREEDILWSFAPHDMSMILSLVGAEPDHVSAEGAYVLHKTIADVTTTHLSFPGGEHAHIFVSWLHPFKEQKLVVVGSRAMAVFDDGRPWASKLTLYSHEINWRNGMPVPQKGEGEAISVEPEEPLQRECAHFLDCVSGATKPRTDGREGLQVLRVLQQAARALCQRAQSPDVTKVDRSETASGRSVHESAYVDDGAEIGSGTKIWHFSHILSGSRIGCDVVVGQNVMIGPDVSVGDRCKIQNNVSLYKGVYLEDGVFCGPSCVFTNVNTPRAEVERKDEFRATLVKRGATIGANATIVCGSTLGEFCFIGAGAVVVRDVPAHALMAGVPARRIGWVSHAGERLDADLVCPRTGRRYQEIATDRLEEIDDEQGSSGDTDRLVLTDRLHRS